MSNAFEVQTFERNLLSRSIIERYFQFFECDCLQDWIRCDQSIKPIDLKGDRKTLKSLNKTAVNRLFLCDSKFDFTSMVKLIAVFPFSQKKRNSQ